LVQESFIIYPIKTVVREEIELTWGPLTMKTSVENKPPHFIGRFSKFNPKVNGKDIEHGFYLRDVIAMLKAGPSLIVNGTGQQGKVILKLHYTDHEGLPFDCDLTYDLETKKIDDQECLDRILSNIKPDDFLNIGSIFLGNELRSFGFTLKIKE